MNTYTPKPLYQSVDWFTILLYAIMVVAGWFSICGASYDFGTGTLLAADSRPLTQLQWIGISLVVIFVVMMLEEELFEMFAYPLYVAVIGLLVLTIFIAPEERSPLLLYSAMRTLSVMLTLTSVVKRTLITEPAFRRVRQYPLAVGFLVLNDEIVP